MPTENKEKRKLLTEPKLKITLSEEQKEVVRKYHEYDINFLIGDFGSGKTLCSCHIALTEFRKKNFNKIWITRPILKNNLGILPNGIDEKMSPYVYPIIQNLEQCQGKEATERMRKSGEIEIIPIDVAKGLTFIDSIIIVDEFQDMIYSDFRTILTRLGQNSKMIFCGSPQQIDKQMKKDTCFPIVAYLEDSGLVGWSTLTANHRNKALTDIIKYLDEKCK